ncbi:MAG: hypothetical protein ACLFUE_05935 [Desulfobacteraceae bacterium]
MNDACSKLACTMLTASVLLLLGLAAGTVHARGGEPDTVLALGAAEVRGNDLAAARKQAVSSALARGVEQYLLERVGEERVSRRLGSFARELIPAARDEIVNFNIIEEETVEGRLFVLVRLRVNQETLAGLLEEKGFGRQRRAGVSLLVMISQSYGRGSEAEYWWQDPDAPGALLPVELALITSLERMGFSMKSRGPDAPSQGAVAGLFEPVLSKEAAAAWGRTCGVDAVLAGQCEFGPEGLRLRLKAVDSVTAAVISEAEAASDMAEGVQKDKGWQRAVEGASERVVGVLGPEIHERFERIEGPARLEVVLDGLGGLRDLRLFSEFLEEKVPGVESVTQTLFKGDSVTFSVEYQGRTDRFVEDIQGHPDLPLPIEVRRIEGDKVVAAVR